MTTTVAISADLRICGTRHLPNSTPHTDARTSAVLCRVHRARAGERGHYASCESAQPCISLK